MDFGGDISKKTLTNSMKLPPLSTGSTLVENGYELNLSRREKFLILLLLLNRNEGPV